MYRQRDHDSDGSESEDGEDNRNFRSVRTDAQHTRAGFGPHHDAISQRSIATDVQTLNASIMGRDEQDTLYGNRFANSQHDDLQLKSRTGGGALSSRK